MDLGDLSTVLDRNHHQQPALFCCAAVLRSCNSAQIRNADPLDSYSIVLAAENGFQWMHHVADALHFVAHARRSGMA